ncbi:MAG: hypothetical protein ACP5D9_05815 [Mariniphaga sp.]
MLNLGLIGDIQLLEPFTKKALELRKIHIAGKSSVGTQPGNLRLSVPEFNRIELIERSDALLINRFSLLPFQLLCDMVKKSKHFFATSYPRLTVEECNHLSKLATEAKTVIQVTNPFYYFPAVLWLNANIKQPALIEVSFFKNEQPATDTLVQLLLMLKNAAGLNPRKAGAVSFHSAPADSEINNIQLEFGNGTLVTINYGKMSGHNEFKIKTWAGNQFTSFDLVKNHFTCNNSPLELSAYKKINETDNFLQSVSENKQSTTDIDDYSSVIQTIQKISSKFSHFSGN